MFSERRKEKTMLAEIERLIDLAVADGQITEKERNVILRKAADLGIDIDEVEMVLDGKLHLATATTSKTGKEKQGDMKVCPACGASVRSLQIVCDYCQHEFRNINSVNSVRVLSEKLAETANRVRESRSGGSHRVALSFLNQLAPNLALKEIYQAQAMIISTFPVPNAKEDLLEFLVIASAEARKTPNRQFGQFGQVYDGSDILIKAWRSKLHELISKAKLTGDPLLLNEIVPFEQQLRQYGPTWIDRIVQTLQKIAKVGSSAILVVFLLITIVIMFFALRLIF
jgi:hypothetical protein